jgi:hypothetical protein
MEGNPKATSAGNTFVKESTDLDIVDTEAAWFNLVAYGTPHRCSIGGWDWYTEAKKTSYLKLLLVRIQTSVKDKIDSKC